MAKKKIVVETVYKAKGTDKVKSSYEGIASSSKKASKSTGDLNKSTGAFTSGLPSKLGVIQSGFIALKGGIMKAVLGMKSLRVAIMSTGIGALIIGFIAIGKYFTDTERGAEKLRVAMAFLGGIMDAVMDVVIMLGEGLVDMFSNPMESLESLGKAIKENLMNRLEGVMDIAKALGKIFSGDLKEGLKDLGNASIKTTTGIANLSDKLEAGSKKAIAYAKHISEVAIASGKLANSLNKLENAERDYSIVSEVATGNREKLIRLSKDQTLSDQERIEALKGAGKIEEDNTKQLIQFAEERLRIITEQNALSESGEADIQKQTEAEVKLIALKNQSANKLLDIKARESALVIAIETDRKAANKKIIADQKKLTTAKETEEKKISKMLLDRQKLNLELQKDGVQKQLDLINFNGEQRRLKLKEDGVLTDELEIKLEEDKQRKLQTVRDNAEAKKKLADDKNSKDAIKLASDTAKQKSDLEKELGRQILNFANSLSTALGEESKTALAIQKTVALAQIGIDTAKAISSLVASSSANPANAVSFGGAGAVQFATGLLSIGSNLAQAYSILKQPAPTLGGGDSSSASPPLITNQTAPNLGFDGRSAGVESFGAQTVIKAYVTESDITNSQSTANNIQQLSQIG